MEGGKKFVTFLLIAILALGFGVGGGIISTGYAQRAANTAALPGNAGAEGTNTAMQPDNGGSVQPAVVIQQQDANLGEVIAEKTLDSVVGIETVYESAGGGYWYFFGGGNGSGSETKIQGTGFIVDFSGYLLTNSHVVNDGDYKTVAVYLYDGRIIDGKVLWNDATLDLAIVKIEADNLVAAELGNSDELKVGSYAAALGNPLGLQFKFSMSQGIISGLDRTIEVSSGSNYSSTTMQGLLQTDATINSGNSGGPLVNSKGQVIGINSAKASSGEGMGFAIPINVAKPIVEQIKTSGEFKRAYLGISGMGLEESSSYNAETFKDRYGTESGIYVSTVTEGGGAEAAGLQKGDIILTVGGTEVGTMNKINAVLIAYKAGDTVEVTYLRDGEVKTTEVTLTEGKAQ